MRRGVLIALALALAGCGGGSAGKRETTPAAALPGRELDPARTRTLPAQGLVVSRGEGLVVVGLDGRVLGRLTGFEVDLQGEQGRYDRVVYVRDRGGREWSVGAEGMRRVRRPPVVPRPPGYRGCDRVVAGYVICGNASGPGHYSRVVRRTSGGALRVVAAAVERTASGVVGRWVGVLPSPDRRTLLLQWEAECEVPVAFFADRSGRWLRTVTGERTLRGASDSTALGWARDGRAVVLLLPEGCGSRGRVGTYLVDPRTSERTLVYRGRAALWG